MRCQPSPGRSDRCSRPLVHAAAILAALLSVVEQPLGAAEKVERWGTFEIALCGPRDRNPFVDTRLRARFRCKNRVLEAAGFYDGDGVYRIRCMPDAEGDWTYVTASNARELDGQRGHFTCVPPSPKNHGPVRVFNDFYFAYADGAPYHPFGTTCYAWVHQTRALQQETLKTLSASPFNKIRFCVFPKAYAYNANEPELFAFQRDAGGKFDFARPDPAFWRHLEQRTVDLQKLGIEADIILWHPYDRWGLADMTDAEDDRYLRYAVARLGALRNVWWSLANEYDFMTDRPAGHRGNKQWEDWDRFFSILAEEDPYRHLRSIHNGRKWYDHRKAWVTHASLQTSDMRGGVRFRALYRKPVVYDECKYEGNIPQGWGNLTGREMTQRFWLGTLSGCYVGHGETYRHPADVLWWAKGGVLHGESPQRIQWLRDFMTQAPPFHEFQPQGDDRGLFLLGKPGEYYLLYCVDQRPKSVRLAGERPYKLDLVDPWEMTVAPMGTAPAGPYTVSPPRPELAFRFTPYGPGERLRPEAKITASATEGLPPLSVKFASAPQARAHWDFGDGATSDEPNPTHAFEKPGLYSVTLAVTDAQGASARSFLQIAVDGNPGDPIVRSGLPQGETHALRLLGTCRRTPQGGLHLPHGPPWGWADIGETAVEGLRGLRSFTILGWLKPENLQTGSGGNRIVFCLNGDHSGIDLVCHADGRMRLAVNQWPDSVQNDSSPRKLQVGRWTFFAVTYDATRAGDNVNWYFSDAGDAPGMASIVLDRRTSYNAGPVGTEIGPLTVGNFNGTMRGHGLDRQFRGEIRGLQLFGSRIGGRGAVPLDLVRRQSQ